MTTRAARWSSFDADELWDQPVMSWGVGAE